MADIFEEVEEGLRQDRMTVLWKQYGIFAYLAGALIIGGVGLYEYMQYSDTQNIEIHATNLEAGLTALSDQEYESAASEFTALIAEDVAASPVAAHFLADVRLDGNGDAEAARNVLLAQANNVAEDPLAALALLKAAYLQADTASVEELDALLAPLLSAENAFSALAQELIAAKHFEAGDILAARRAFTELRFSDNVPPGVITRANRALESMPVVTEATETEIIDAVEAVDPADDVTTNAQSDVETEE